MPSRVNADHSGIGAGEDIEHSSLATGDRNRIEDGRSQSMSVQFAPTDSLRQPGVYTIQEVLSLVNQKLDEHGRQLQAIWAILLSIEFEQAALKREFDEMKDDEKLAAARDEKMAARDEKNRQHRLLLIFCLLTVVALIIIIVMLAWLIVNLG